MGCWACAGGLEGWRLLLDVSLGGLVQGRSMERWPLVFKTTPGTPRKAPRHELVRTPPPHHGKNYRGGNV